jgi:hypothetical protein
MLELTGFLDQTCGGCHIALLQFTVQCSGMGRCVLWQTGTGGTLHLRFQDKIHALQMERSGSS